MTAAATTTTTAVLGGGLAGLSAAYYLSKAGSKNVTVFEAARRLGGWIQTEQHTQLGFRFEKGPRTIRPVGVRGANTLHMVQDLGLESNLVPVSKTHVAAKNRMIFAHDKLHLLPSSLSSLFRKLSPFSKPLISAALYDLQTGRSPTTLHDESIYDFAHRRFGEETAKYLVSSMICGICAGDARQISVKFLMDEVFRKEQQYGGVLKGVFYGWFEKNNVPDTGAASAESSRLVQRAQKERWSVYSFREGLEMLPKRLTEHIAAAGVSIQCSSECRAIRVQDNSDVVNLTMNGSTHQVSHVVSSLPSFRLAPLLADNHRTLADELMAIPYVDVAVVNLQYEGDALVRQPGFGFLVPPSENLPILGVIYDSCCFPMNGKTVLTVMMGGAWFKQRLGTNPSNKDLYDIAVKQVSRIMQIDAQPTTGRVHILHKCIPQYVVGHVDRVRRIRQYVRDHKLPLTLCGSAFDGVGVNDVIFSARQALANRTIL